jgi:uncharacterized DUF497 family protein
MGRCQSGSQPRSARHGIAFDGIGRFDWESSVPREDTRGDYGERRFLSIGRSGARLHVALCTARGGRRRLISLRKPNPRERALYDRG